MCAMQPFVVAVASVSCMVGRAFRRAARRNRLHFEAVDLFEFAPFNISPFRFLPHQIRYEAGHVFLRVGVVVPQERKGLLTMSQTSAYDSLYAGCTRTLTEHHMSSAAWTAASNTPTDLMPRERSGCSPTSSATASGSSSS